MTTVAILFWAGVFLVFYTYLGYGILLWLLVKIREAVHPARRYAFPADPPEVTLLIAAYNEQEVVAEKMANCRALDYPAGKLRVTWITDGSTDRTVELLAAYPEVTVLHNPRRGGKTAAMNRALGIIRTPLVVFTDANTMLNPEAVTQIVRCFEDPQWGAWPAKNASPGQGIRAPPQRKASTGNTSRSSRSWITASTRRWGQRGVVRCAARTVADAEGGYAARRFRLLDADRGTGIQDRLLQGSLCAGEPFGRHGRRRQTQEAHRGGRAAIGMAAAQAAQSVPLRGAVVPVRIAPRAALDADPVVLVALLPLNVALLWSGHPALYAAILALQCAFYLAALTGWALERSGHRNRLLFIPYYFLFMNLNVFRGASYLATHRGKGAWEKARRA